MNYQKVTKFDTANGTGIRTVLWVSGCSHQCPGCHNPQTWDELSGELFTNSVLEDILDSLSSDYIAGLTLSGGDPLYWSNLNAVRSIITTVKCKYPNKSIWLYTGYKWEELSNANVHKSIISDILSHIDVLVDGRFELDKKDITLPYCGSSNQRVIDVKASLGSNSLVLYKDE